MFFTFWTTGVFVDKALGKLVPEAPYLCNDHASRPHLPLGRIHGIGPDVVRMTAVSDHHAPLRQDPTGFCV